MTKEIINKNYNLLVVDDELEVTKALARQFRKKYNIFTATNAMQAIDVMESQHIQVVLSDQRMPGLTGIDFFSKIKDKYPDALKLIITGYSDIEAVIGAINEGQVFRYITKPWNPVELESTIKEAFEKYELITKNRKLMLTLREANQSLEEKIRLRTKELERSNIKLRELNTEKNKYIGIVAHDLRNPIGTAQSFANLLLDEWENNSANDKIEYLKIINERCEFALDLIVDFLDASKIEAGIFEITPKIQNYIQFVNQDMNYIRMLAENKKIKIKVKTKLSELMVNFDKNKMEQVLINLLSNAIKYSFPNKNITIEILVVNNHVVTNIIDEGQGIHPDEIHNIFNPYRVTSVKSTANEKSTGLGLAIVKKIIDAHSGTVSVKSKIGEGSVFSFTLPL